VGAVEFEAAVGRRTKEGRVVVVVQGDVSVARLRSATLAFTLVVPSCRCAGTIQRVDLQNYMRKISRSHARCPLDTN
jgi:hypothetical protein